MVAYGISHHYKVGYLCCIIISMFWSILGLIGWGPVFQVNVLNRPLRMCVEFPIDAGGYRNWLVVRYKLGFLLVIQWPFPIQTTLPDVRRWCIKIRVCSVGLLGLDYNQIIKYNSISSSPAALLDHEHEHNIMMTKTYMLQCHFYKDLQFDETAGDKNLIWICSK